MSVTDEDRQKARRIVSNWLVNFGPNEFDPLQAMIETHLAAEREKARAPLLALAEELDRQSEKADANSGSGYLTNEYARGCATAFELSADRIRDALDPS